MIIVVYIVGAIVLAGLVYLACLDGNFEVRRSHLIDASVQDCFDAVVDLKSWPQWSPWLLHEPDARLEYSADHRTEGGYYSWDGKQVGAGRLTHVSIKPGRSIAQQIEFTRPFKSTSEVGWYFEKQESGTLVSWEMRGRMPFLFRFLAKKMEPAIGRDYELGLALLGGYVNKAMPHPEINLDGPETLEAFNYWAIPCHGNLRQLEGARRSSIETLRAAAGPALGMSLTLFQDFDPGSGHYRAELAIPVLDNMPTSNYQTREFSGGDYFRLSVRGDLEFLPLAWHALASHCRLFKIKVDRQRPALEIYAEDPGYADGDKPTTTTLYLPIKSRAAADQERTKKRLVREDQPNVVIDNITKGGHRERG